MTDFVSTVIVLTFSRMIAILGFFFVIGFFLSILQNATQKIYRRSVGWYGILWTAWIGTPVHELSHYLFAKLFFHKINHVDFFEPNKETGNLGHVEHSYNPKNIYQSIGNFFIGSAPLIIGSVILTLLFWFLLPNGKEIWNIAQNIALNDFKSLLDGAEKITMLFFSKENMQSPRFWFFVYISFSVAAHIAPSSYDRKTMGRGLLWLFGILGIVTIGTEFANYNPAFFTGENSFRFLTLAFWYALAVSITHFVCAWLIFMPIRGIRLRYDTRKN